MTQNDMIRMALEALEVSTDWDVNATGKQAQSMRAITALRQAIEDEEKQEPVAWRYNGKLHEFDPSDWATGPVTPLYTSPPAKPWVNPSLKEYEEIILANMTPKNLDEREAVIGALNDMVVLLKEKNQ